MNFCLLLILSVHSGTGPARAGCPLLVKFQLPKEGDAFQRGLAALKENRLEEALVEFTTAEREHPENGRIRNFRGILGSDSPRSVARGCLSQSWLFAVDRTPTGAGARSVVARGETFSGRLVC